MVYKISYWDSETKSQKERDATPDETADFERLKVVKYVPQSVPMRSARLILLQYNLLTAVQSYVDSAGGVEGEIARINWEYALTVNRNDDLVKTLINVLNKTSAEIDQMFIEASQL